MSLKPTILDTKFAIITSFNNLNDNFFPFIVAAVPSKCELEMLDDSDLARTPTASASGGDGAEFAAAKYVLKSPLACGDTASMLGGCEVGDCPSEASEGTDHSQSVHHHDQTALTVFEKAKASVESSLLSDPPEIGLKEKPKPLPPSSEWLWSLLNTDLFHPCPHHATLRKNECNFFCFGCTGSRNDGMALCRHCLVTHTCDGAVRMFQIRRYMYQNVVHAEDLASTRYDLSGIQAYCINSKRAILLHPKPAPPTALAAPAFENKCRGCLIPLRPDCMYCSLRCKVDVDFGLEPATPFLSRAPGPVKSVKGTSADWADTGVYNLYNGTGTDLSVSRRWSSQETVSFTGSKRRKLMRPRRSHVM